MLWLSGTSADLRRGSTRARSYTGLLGALGGALPPLGESRVLPSGKKLPPGNKSAGFGQAKSCILVYLFGGPSHIDIWDMKPDAPRRSAASSSRSPPTCPASAHRTLAAAGAARRPVRHHPLAGPRRQRPRLGRPHHDDRPPAARPARSGRTLDDFPHFGSVLARIESRQLAEQSAPRRSSRCRGRSRSTHRLVPGQNGASGRAGDPFPPATPCDADQ